MRKQNKKFRDDILYRIHRLKHFAKKYGWKTLAEADPYLEFESIHNWGLVTDSSVKLKIEYHKLEVETSLNHPKKGNTQLLRQGQFSMNLIEKIFRNPRSHMPSSIISKYIV